MKMAYLVMYQSHEAINLVEHIGGDYELGTAIVGFVAYKFCLLLSTKFF